MSDPATPAVETPEPSATYALTPEQELSGDFPGPAVEPVAEPEPAAEPVTPSATAAEATRLADERRTGKSRRQEQINDLIIARQESDARAARLEADIQALKAPKTAAEPVTAALVSDPKDPEPVETDFEDYRAFVKATAKWEIRQAKREADAEKTASERAESDAAQRESFATLQTTWQGRRDTFTTAHPDKAERVLAFLGNIHAGTPIGDTIMESEVGAELADHLAANPAEADRIARLAPLPALLALGRLEATLDSTPATSASASAGPAAKLVTTAPAPPTTLSARSAAPADPARAAVDDGDFAAFEAEENRKALAASR